MALYKFVSKIFSWKILLAVLGALILIFIGSNLYLSYYYQNFESQFLVANQLRSKLDQPQLSFPLLKEGVTVDLPAKISSWQEFRNLIDSIPNLQMQITEVEQDFEDKLDGYQAQVSSYIDPEQVFGKIDRSQIEFAVKQSPEPYFADLRLKFRNYLVDQNKNSENIVYRYELDPQQMIAAMSLEEKVKQMFVYTIDGTQLTPGPKQTLESAKPAGVVMLGANVKSPEQISAFNSQLQGLDTKKPLFILVDQEGGVVRRVTWENLGSQRQIAQLPEQSRCDVYKKRSDLLASLGFNFNLGIVADVTSNPNSFIYSRVYSGNYQQVSELVSQALDCTKGIINTVKHYPGHGATNGDTHLGIEIMGISKQEWENTHLLPFKTDSLQKPYTIMTGHLILQDIDPNKPASLSAAHIDYLREEIGFTGLIVTDDMLMLDNADIDRQSASEQAILAGNDLLLYSLPADRASYPYRHIINQVKKGNIPESTINESVIRILEYKNYLVRQQSTFVPAELVW